MKIIEILQKVANGEIEKGTKLWLEECSFNFDGDSFTNEQYPFGNSIFLSTRFLNKEVELIPSKEKRYAIKLNIRGFLYKYLNYNQTSELVHLNDLKEIPGLKKAKFTKSEMQDIKTVREFLADAEGKYELIEVLEDETY